VEPHPIRLVVQDDLRRSRLTVFFRLLLAIPHLWWLSIWTFGAFFAVIGNWFATLVRGRSPLALHNFLAGYVRYTTHVNAYLFLAANPYPGFVGQPGSYPIDVEIDEPRRQSRWGVGFRMLLAIPAFFLAGALIGWGGARAGYVALLAGTMGTAAFLGWFAALVTGRMPDGMRDLVTYALRYVAQFDAYLFLLTGRYPDSDPGEYQPRLPGDHPIRLEVRDDLRRSRLTVFFRLLLTLPHQVWLTLWSVVALLAAVAAWFATLAMGRCPRPLHRFLAAYLRYSTHVSAFLFLVANPFPGFTGTPGIYPVDVEIQAPERQSRWITGFRGLLAFPALILLSALTNLLFVVGLLGWFYSLARGRMTPGLRNLGAYVLRYNAQTYGYLFLLTDRYAHSAPPA
jgi:hypothetical protein